MRGQLLGTAATLAAIFGLAACAGNSAIGLENLLARHTAARGGSTAIQAVHAMRARIEISEPGFRVRGDYVATRDGFMRIDIFDGEERVFTEALGPDGGWQLPAGANSPVPLSRDGARALRRGLIGNLYGLHELPGLGYRLHERGSVRMDGSEYRVIDLVADDGHAEQLFLNADNYQVERKLVLAALHPDADPTKLRRMTIYGGFADAGGVSFPRTEQTIDLETGGTLQSVTVTELHINPLLDGRRFRPPPRMPMPDPSAGGCHR